MTARGVLALPVAETWTDHAPCAGQWWLTDPLGDAGYVHRDSYIIACLPALDLCRTCPFTTACVDRVRPAESGFDGVCGGRVWRSGRVVHSVRGVAA